MVDDVNASLVVDLPRSWIHITLVGSFYNTHLFFQWVCYNPNLGSIFWNFQSWHLIKLLGKLVTGRIGTVWNEKENQKIKIKNRELKRLNERDLASSVSLPPPSPPPPLQPPRTIRRLQIVRYCHRWEFLWEKLYIYIYLIWLLLLG